MTGKSPIKLSHLLRGRQRLLQRANLANSAYAYALLGEIARRAARANLRGRVTLKSADPEEDRFWATLTTVSGHQSLLEEHFTEEDVQDFADAVEFITGGDPVELTFEIEDVGEIFLAPLRSALEQARVQIDRDVGVPHPHSPSERS
jgi:hypothetical protein